MGEQKHLDENEVLDLLGGLFAASPEVWAHLDTCDDCLDLVALAARADGSPELVEPRVAAGGG